MSMAFCSINSFNSYEAKDEEEVFIRAERHDYKIAINVLT